MKTWIMGDNGGGSIKRGNRTLSSKWFDRIKVSGTVMRSWNRSNRALGDCNWFDRIKVSGIVMTSWNWSDRASGILSPRIRGDGPFRRLRSIGLSHYRTIHALIQRISRRRGWRGRCLPCLPLFRRFLSRHYCRMQNLSHFSVKLLCYAQNGA